MRLLPLPSVKAEWMNSKPQSMMHIITPLPFCDVAAPAGLFRISLTLVAFTEMSVSGLPVWVASMRSMPFMAAMLCTSDTGMLTTAYWPSTPSIRPPAERMAS